MGGTGRLLMSAFTLAAGSTGQMLQAATVNVIQSYGAQQIKLIADSMKSEVAPTALQVLGSQLPKSRQGLSATIPIILGASGSASSTTRSGISGARKEVTITNAAAQRALTGQTPEQTVASIKSNVTSEQDNSNALAPIFNQQEIEAGFAIVGTLAREAGTFLESRTKEIDSKKAAAKKLEAQAEDCSQPLTVAERQVLQEQANQLQTQAEEVQKHWGPGGPYRQITTALLAGVGGNIAAGTGAFIQGAVVNYIQQDLAKEVGNLVAAGSLTEGSPSHATLHAIIAAAGAAASGQDIASAAAGSAAATLLTNLFEPPTPDATEGERTAKRHLLTTLVSGIAAAAGGDVVAANTAALANVDNNWLASQQIAQAKKEYLEAQTLLEKTQVLGKWAYISGRQDFLTLDGILVGLVKAGWHDVQGLAHFLRHPSEGVNGIKKLLSDPAVMEQLGLQLYEHLNAKADRIALAFREGGDQHAAQLGRDIGELVWQVTAVVTGIQGVAKGGAVLAKVGIKLGKQGLKAAKAVQTLGLAVAVENGAAATAEAVNAA